MDRTIPKQFSVTRAQPNFQALLDAAPDAMVGVDPQGKIVMANVQTEELFGYRREELIGQPIEVLVPERVRAAHPAHRTGYFDHPRTRPTWEWASTWPAGEPTARSFLQRSA